MSTNDSPHRICTPSEYFFKYRPKGKHSVCFDYDGCGGVGIWYEAQLPEEEPLPAQDGGD